MPKSSRSSRASAILLSLMLSLLAACSPPLKPSPPAVVVKPLKPLVDPELLIPPEVSAINRLLQTLQLPPVNAVTPSTP